MLIVDEQGCLGERRLLQEASDHLGIMVPIRPSIFMSQSEVRRI